MTVTTGATTPAAEPEEAASGEPGIRCAQCGAPMEDDQEWCLDCGAARTLVHRPPDWRIAGGIIASIALLALVALAIVLINLSSDANSAASAALTSTVTVTAPARAAAPAPPASAATATAAVPSRRTPRTSATTKASGKTAGAAGFAGWSAGLDGWTTVLASTASEDSAVTVAEKLRARGLSVGVFSSSEHPAMRAGRWIVYSGRFPTRAEARANAISLRSRGFETARPAVVGRTGG